VSHPERDHRPKARDTDSPSASVAESRCSLGSDETSPLSVDVSEIGFVGLCVNDHDKAATNPSRNPPSKPGFPGERSPKDERDFRVSALLQR